MLKIAVEPISLETPIGEEKIITLGTFLKISPQTPFKSVLTQSLSDQTLRVGHTYSKGREGIEDEVWNWEGDHTLEEVGQNFDVTRERIRQIEAKALRKLRHPSRSKKLRAFMESSVLPMLLMVEVPVTSGWPFFILFLFS